MKALVAQALTGTAGLAYVDVDDVAAPSGHAVIVDVGARPSWTPPTAKGLTWSWTRSAARPSTTPSGCWHPGAGLLVIGFAAGGGIPTVKVNRLLLRNVSVVALANGGIRGKLVLEP